MPSIETTNISSAIAQTAHPTSNNSVRPTVTAPPSSAQVALAAQQAVAATAVKPREDAVRITQTPKRVEGIFAVQKEPDATEEDSPQNDDQPEGHTGSPPKKKLSLRV
jgi:hypothetical protein